MIEGMAKIEPLAGMFYSFRHAVVLLDSSGKPLPPTPEAENLARELLIEYGAARGGESNGYVITDSWDFDRVTGYAMEFVGGPTEPRHETRLRGLPRRGKEMLRGFEEEYRVLEPET